MRKFSRLASVAAAASLALSACGGGENAQIVASSASNSLEVHSLIMNNSAVVPINWGSFTAAAPTDADSVRIRSLLRNANKYALNTWWSSKGYSGQSQTYLDFGGIEEVNIRAPSSEAVSLAIALKMGGYSEAVTGVTEANAKAIALKLIRSLAYRHKKNTAGGWGDQWQSALWAAQIGTAGWLLWDDLSATDQEYVRLCVGTEANRFIGYQTPYFKNRAGTVQTPGDSKAEENSWNATVLQIATAMMPNHPNFEAWMFKNAELMVSSYAKPSNINNTTSFFNGGSLAWWLEGSNANDDLTVINHDRIHPDYMMTVSQNLRAALVYPMAGKPVPRAALVNAAPLYTTLVDLSFTAGASYPDTNTTIYAPGGTIFKANSPDLYFPQGNDWGTMRRMNSANMDVMARAFSLDGGASVKAPVWEARHAQLVADMQARSTTGQTYVASGEDTYSGREEWVAALAGYAYWTKWITSQGIYSTTDQKYPVVVDNGDRGFSVQSGTWTSATSGVGMLGTGYRTHAAGTGTNRVRFKVNVPASGSYEVYGWWPAGAGNATNTPYAVTHNAGTTLVAKNQQLNGGQWNSLGTFSFTNGSNQYVDVTDSANGTVIADGILIRSVP